MKLIPFSICLIYVFWAVGILVTGHLHEDAYILYIYAKNLANGYGISYFPGGGPAEGATDFLWMLILALGEATGLDAALMAAILNGLGLATICWLTIKLATTKPYTVTKTLPILLLTTLILSSQITQASFAGFSTGFYCAFVAVLFYLLYTRNNKQQILVPVVGIILGLIRPDGVIVGVAATLIAGYSVYNSDSFRIYVRVVIACATVGVLYFIWRYQYFGHWLPLPLYVKGSSPDTLPGLNGHIAWASGNFFLGIAGLTAIVFLRNRQQVILASVPVGILLVALTFASQTQNVADRFQAPATTLLILWLAILSRQLTDTLKKPLGISSGIFTLGMAGLVLMALLQNVSASRTLARYLTSHEYINTFPYYLAPHTASDVSIALTEAGRFALWLPGKKFDLIGLNTPDVALHKLSPDYLAALNPDLIFFHQAGTASYRNDCSGNICELTQSKALEGILNQRHWYDDPDPVTRAPQVIYEHMRNNPDRYRVFAVMYNNDYRHIYLIRRDGKVDTALFLATLEKSFDPASALSYWQIQRSWRTSIGYMPRAT